MSVFILPKNEVKLEVGVKRPADPVKNKEDLKYIQQYLLYDGGTSITDKKRARNERNYILFVLGISTGYRAGDIVGLTVKDIKVALNKGYFEILESKKEKNKRIKSKKYTRKVLITSKLKKRLKELGY